MHFEFLDHIGNIHLDIKPMQGIVLWFHFVRPEPYGNRKVSFLSVWPPCRFFFICPLLRVQPQLLMSGLLLAPQVHSPHNALYFTPWSLHYSLGPQWQESVIATPGQPVSVDRLTDPAFSSLFISGILGFPFFVFL